MSFPSQMQRPSPSVASPADRLDSWKEIATYLNRGVRTVQRWEREKGLPVRRLPGGDQARVHALKSELDQWWDSRGIHLAIEDARPAGASWRPYALWFGAAALVASMAGLLIWLRTARPSNELKPIPLVSMGGTAGQPTPSPDGKRVAFQWAAPKELPVSENRSGIYVQQIGSSGPPVRLTGRGTDWNPSWSPDDRYIAFMRGGGTESAVVLIPAIGGLERTITTVNSSRSSRLIWTPDAKWLILSLREAPGEPNGMWALSPETGERRRILPPPPVVTHPDDDTQGDLVEAVSPDGLTLAFARGEAEGIHRLYALRLTRELQPNGKPWVVTDRSYGLFYGAVWTSGGEIVFSAIDGIPRLWRVPVSGHAFPRLIASAAPAAQWPALMRSRHRLLYKFATSTINLWRYDLHTGESRMLVSSGYQQYNAQYSPDGRRIAFQSNRSGSLEVWRSDANGDNWQQLTFFGGPVCGVPRWSPDSRWLALDSRIEGKSQIYVMPADGGVPRRVTQGDSQNEIPSWSRDGKWIYFESDRSGAWRIWKTSVDSSAAVPITQNISGTAFESADGKYVYVAPIHYIGGGQRPSQLFRVPATGGEQTLVVPNVLNSNSFAVTAKGVYFMSDPQTLQLFDPQTARIRTLAKLDRAGGISVSPDDAYVIYGRPDRSGADIMLVENFR